MPGCADWVLYCCPLGIDLQQVQNQSVTNVLSQDDDDDDDDDDNNDNDVMKMDVDPVDFENLVTTPWWQSWKVIQQATVSRPNGFEEFKTCHHRYRRVSSIKHAVGSYGFVDNFECIDGDFDDVPLVAKRIRMDRLLVNDAMTMDACLDPLSEIAIQHFLYEITALSKRGPIVPRIYEVFAVFEPLKRFYNEIVVVMEKLDCTLDQKMSGLYHRMKLARTEKDKNAVRAEATDLCSPICIWISQCIFFLQDQYKFEHRDLKPSNIMFRETQPCLIDFGFSRITIGRYIIAGSHPYTTSLNFQAWRDLALFSFATVVTYSSIFHKTMSSFFSAVLSFPTSSKHRPLFDIQAFIHQYRNKAYESFHEILYERSVFDPFCLPIVFVTIFQKHSELNHEFLMEVLRDFVNDKVNPSACRERVRRSMDEICAIQNKKEEPEPRRIRTVTVCNL